MKNEISNIEKTLSTILKSDTNNLITVSSNDKDLTEITEQLFDFSKSIDIYDEVERNICINNILEDCIVSFYGLFKGHNINSKIEICEKNL